MAINENDELYVWGWNGKGQLGLGDSTHKLKPTLNSFFKNKKIIKLTCGRDHNLALIENGEVYSWGYYYYGQLGHGDTNNRNTPTLISFFKGMNVMDVFVFYCQSFVYSWGFYNNGQLGHNDTKHRYIPTKINGLIKIKKIFCGSNHTMAINENDELYVWGGNDYGQFGLGGSSSPNEIKPSLNSFFKNKKL